MFNKHGESHSKARRPFLRSGKVVAAVVVASVGLLAVPAHANTTNPTSIKAKAVVNPNGSATVTVSGNWTWPGGQACSGRYGTSWVVGWWGTGTSSSPAKSFTLTNATQVLSEDQGINGNPVAKGSITPNAALKIPAGYTSLGGQNIYVGAKMNGQSIYTPSFCAVAQPSGKDLSGTYTASATYASVKDVPEKICVVTYDVHGSATKGATDKDYDPIGNGDNSVDKKQFTPETNCATVTTTTVPNGGVWGYIGITALGAAGLAAFGMRNRRTRRGLSLA